MSGSHEWLKVLCGLITAFGCGWAYGHNRGYKDGYWYAYGRRHNLTDDSIERLVQGK